MEISANTGDLIGITNQTVRLLSYNQNNDNKLQVFGLDVSKYKSGRRNSTTRSSRGTHQIKLRRRAP